MEIDLKNIVLEDESGNKCKFELVTKFDIEDREYVIVVPKDAKNSGEAIALRIDKDIDGNAILLTVEDEKEFSSVASEYEMLFKDDMQN
ncbi:DUF1292 domain-containing protein [Clostridium tyrobutyricum]|jgi:uncharacterized protein YrzB (UPF0473 family)|uniref:Uncharacterized protein n=1 Tax=Clostridium tyrobutyricum DIVETGP TaxID=1408889 RepID=W6N1F6_CLOTY|nr:DUF1292 domain-containing protein [Clostridium tyrobutyricum]AND85140.1 hypothetical protein CTK_C18880 [Clostridium tyrobutyricum]ANP69699.1 hypothetical protein BA182_08445 [Clostridium tyrobutyricum]MBR9646968.1 DUF1292 domain-containing protein [Clostridium tyrobutyricum]MBV4423939.1 DUF1292 domain-containing protein [Clostridium tyrobutyricum]MBV4432941.1 DUF1292 domain-containing protein [Clostridium tyrobutyricum]